MRRERLAVIGVGLRFPGGISEAESFWKFLSDGGDAITEIPADRWNIARYYDPEPALPGKSSAKRGGFIDGIDQFDPQFFGISPREAPHVDPQHRLLLETAWEAIEDAGLVLDLAGGTDLGVFVGISHNDYQTLQFPVSEYHRVAPFSPTGTAHSIAANRISYCLNLIGPSVAMDTACSSGLTAVHAACEHIWAGRGDMALAGGVTVLIGPGGFIGFSQATMLSPDGRCAAFDAAANGFVRSEGAGMVLIKRLSDALRDGDPIRGVILASGLNQDGHTNGISLPSPEAQQRLVEQTCREAGITPETVDYVEAHGTGTAAGDPIEATALSRALCAGRGDEERLLVGSVKTNIGHLETAAGIAGMVKAMLVLQHGQVPPNLHFHTPNPHIDMDGLKLRVPVQTEPLAKSRRKRIAGVNSFGFGGANAHVVLQEPPAPARRRARRAAKASMGSRPLVLSARSEAALAASADRLADWISGQRDGKQGTADLDDLVYTLGARRNHHPYRLGLSARTLDEAATQLKAFAADPAEAAAMTAFTPRADSKPTIGFVFSGQGPQWFGMARELMEREPVFRAAMERCAEALEPWVDFSLFDELARDEAESQIQNTKIAQPAIFAMQVALAELWRSWGIEPSAVVAHSVGEVAAAYVAGVLPLEEAARVIAMRARRMEECGRGIGGMLAVGMDEAEANELIARHDPEVSIAAYNAPRSLSLAGRRSSLLAMADALQADNVFARMIGVDYPFHHAMMQPACDLMATDLDDIVPQEARLPYFSSITGRRCGGPECGANFWARGIRGAVHFESAARQMAQSGIDYWIELSANPALTRAVQDCLAAEDRQGAVLASARRDREHDSMVEAALKLHLAGVAIDFSGMTQSRRIVTLPTYPWDRQRWWNEARDSRESRLAPGGQGLLDYRQPRANPTWIARLDTRHMAYLKDHKVDDHVIFPAAAFVDMALEAGRELFDGAPFAIEDFEIRKPLLLTGDPSDIALEIAYSSIDRTFEISSRSESSGFWSLHVVGSLRGERIRSHFADAAFVPLAAAREVDTGEFYARMHDLGLRYGEEFRGASRMAAADGHASGQVCLSDQAARRAGEYALHPVLFDCALHVFTAGAMTVEDRNARTKLPVRFEKILYLASPGSEALVSSRVVDGNEEFVEGDFELFDSRGRPCVKVTGFRAVAIADSRRTGAGNLRDTVYHVDWELVPAVDRPQSLRPHALENIADVARSAIDEVMRDRGSERIDAALDALNALTAAMLARGFRDIGVRNGSDVTRESLGVASPMAASFARLAQRLTELGLFEARGEQWRAAKDFEAGAARAASSLAEFIRAYPGYLAEALLTEQCCGELGPILRGEKDAVQVLFSNNGSDLLDHVYSDSLMTSHWLAAMARAIAHCAAQLPEGRPLRILEVGAGTGGLSAQVLAQIEHGDFTYVFSDISAAFFPAAEQKLANFRNVEFKVFDIEKPGTEQDFEAESFDFIIGSNVLHAVRDLRATLGHLHELLAPGGNLFCLDMPVAQLWTDAIFGLTSGWWRFQDRDLRSDHPLLGVEGWRRGLAESGFADCDFLHGATGAPSDGPQMAILARKASPTTDEDRAGAEASPEESRWIVVDDSCGTGSAVAKRLEAAGHAPVIVSCDTELGAEKWGQVLASFPDGLPQRIVFCRASDARMSGSGDFSRDLDALLHLVQALEPRGSKPLLRLDLVTQGAQRAGRGADPVDPAQAPALGLLRVIGSERPDIACRAIDLPRHPSATDIDHLWRELLDESNEQEIALREEARYVRRLDRNLAVQRAPLARDMPVRLQSSERGHLDTLQFVPFAPPPCAAGEVLVDVRAAGMNFRDVLKALALYPGEAPDARVFGDEIAGTVIAVGEGVDHVAPGDRVYGLGLFGMATRSLARAGALRRIPDRLSFEEAATLPVVFLTAWHALDGVARIRKGETVLVHAGAGGVGMAAIQIAHHFGARVIASAGSPAKRELLKTLGVEHVIDSRRDDFAEAVLDLTDRRGVDCVINALASEAIPMGMACLAEFGRFIEIGKRDIYQNARIPLWPLRKNASFHVVAMDAVFQGSEDLTQEMLSRVGELVDEGLLLPLPFRAFPASRADAAFRLMASGKHIGKVLVSFAPPFLPRTVRRDNPARAVSAEGSYVVTGGFGGFGKVVARWLAEAGAGEVILTGRSGARTEDDERFVEELRASGTGVQVVAGDIAKADDVARVLAAATKPVRGVFHLAMVLDDALLEQLTPERVAAVVDPKARGAWLLHEATRNLDLDCFVMFSSVSSILGNASQGNYSAANAFLDTLADHRAMLGLPALAVNWGVLADAGYVAENKAVADFLERQGWIGLSTREVIATLDFLLRAGAERATIARMDWAKWRGANRGVDEGRLLERLYASLDDSAEAGTSSDWRARIDAATDEERPAIVSSAVRAIVGGILRVKPDSLRDEQPLADLGLDSLMGVEIEIALENELGVGLPPSSLVRARTIGQVAVLIGESLGGVAATAPIAPPDTPPMAEDDLLVDLDAISEDELAQLLDD